MLRCKNCYADACPLADLKLVGNSLAAWPAKLMNCRRTPHHLRESKPFMRDKISCKECNASLGAVQNNLGIGAYMGKTVALFRPGDVVVDCGNGTIVDFPSWKALREMLDTKKPEVAITSAKLIALARGGVEIKQEPPEAKAPPRPKASPVKREVTANNGAAKRTAPAQAQEEEPLPKKSKLVPEPVDPAAWLANELGEYPDAIRLVSSVSGENYNMLIQEAKTTELVAYDLQWKPDFDDGTDNPVALLQLAFPTSGNTYVVQMAGLKGVVPPELNRLFGPSVETCGFASDAMDVHKLQISGFDADLATLVDVQCWAEAEMGENQSVLQGWRVGLKRASACVLDFEMDKTQAVASSTWSRATLTTAQVEYAAMDVWVALRLYQRLAPIYR